MSVSLSREMEGVEAWGRREGGWDRMLECVALYVAGRRVSRRSSLSLIFMKSRAYIGCHPGEPLSVWQESPCAAVLWREGKMWAGYGRKMQVYVALMSRGGDTCGTWLHGSHRWWIYLWEINAMLQFPSPLQPILFYLFVPSFINSCNKLIFSYKKHSKQWFKPIKVISCIIIKTMTDVFLSDHKQKGWTSWCYQAQIRLHRDVKGEKDNATN